MRNCNSSKADGQGDWKSLVALLCVFAVLLMEIVAECAVGSTLKCSTEIISF